MDVGAYTDCTSGITAWREQGAGSVVVFLHGLGGTRLSWGPQLRALSNQYRCIAWDMPGYGDSAPLEPLTYTGIAQRLVHLLDTLEVERANLVGLSFGGMHALHTAINHPDRVGKMVLANTSPAFGMDGTRPQDWIRKRLKPIERGATPADGAEVVIDSITARPLTGTIRQETIDGFGQIGAQGFRAAVECLPSNDVRPQLDSIDHQALVVVGELDHETPVEYAQVLADGLSNASLTILDGIGHLSPAEDPVRFNDLVRNFLGPNPTTNLETS